jgi:hypothetical protein
MLHRSLIKALSKNGPKTDPYGTLDNTSKGDDITPE